MKWLDEVQEQIKHAQEVTDLSLLRKSGILWEHKISVGLFTGHKEIVRYD